MGKSNEPRTIEEYVKGPEGEESQGLAGAIVRAIEEAKSRSTPDLAIDQIFVTCRITPAAGGSSTLAWSTRFATSISPLTAGDRLAAHLDGNPGGAFHGVIRCDFKSAGDTAIHLASFTRNMRPESLPDDDAGGDGAPMVMPADDPFKTYFRPMMDLVLQATSAQVATMNASAQRETASAQFHAAMGAGLTGLVSAIRGATPAGGGDGGGLMTLLGSALGLAQAAGVQVPPVVTAGAAVARQLSSSAPPPPSPVPSSDVPPPPAPTPGGGGAGASMQHTAPPSPVAQVETPTRTADVGGPDPRTFSREQIKVWAEANPDDAKNMIADMARERGAPPMVIQMITG